MASSKALHVVLDCLVSIVVEKRRATIDKCRGPLERARAYVDELLLEGESGGAQRVAKLVLDVLDEPLADVSQVDQDVRECVSLAQALGVLGCSAEIRDLCLRAHILPRRVARLGTLIDDLIDANTRMHWAMRRGFEASEPERRVCLEMLFASKAFQCEIGHREKNICS
jgi:hypothetical protein